MKLVVDKEACANNLDRSRGIIFSQRVLLELIGKGYTRNEAYEKVQKVAFVSRDKNIDFKSALLEDDELAALFTGEELKDLFALRYHLKNVDRIFRRIGI